MCLAFTWGYYLQTISSSNGYKESYKFAKKQHIFKVNLTQKFSVAIFWKVYPADQRVQVNETWNAPMLSNDAVSFVIIGKTK